MERSALCHLRAPSKHINSGRLQALPPSRLTAVRRGTCGGSRRDLDFRPDAPLSLANPLWIGCKSSASGESSAQTEPNSYVPLTFYPLDKNLVKAFRQPPEVTATAAPKVETWPAGGYKATEFDSTVADQFFNREDELKYIKEVITDVPEEVILLLGPRSCGKTALIEELMKEDQERFLHLNCGIEIGTSSNLMAQALKERASKLPAAVGVALRSLPAVSKFSWVSSILPALWWKGFPSAQVNKDALASPSDVYDLVSDFFSENKDNNLTHVINLYKKVLVENAKPGKKPVFIIDEANMLKKWGKTPEEKRNLDGLLNFLKRICKEQNKAHVILSTSESFMVTWLQKNGFTGEVRVDVVLGDLTREEALRFVVGGKDSSGNAWPGLISAFENFPALQKGDWEKVWAMCGGNIKLLRRCVKRASKLGDWGKAVKSVGAASKIEVNAAWLYDTTFSKEEGREAVIWTSEDYQIAIGLIADAAPYYAVPRIVMAAELEKAGRLSKQGRGGIRGINVLNSMIEYNVLYVRPYSDMAKDIPREVFFRTVEGGKGIKKEEEDSVVVLPSPAHLFAALKLLG